MDQILGQSRAIDNLHTAFSAGRLHHALIFHGPAGIGKFTTALALAKLVLCHEPQRDLSGRPSPCDGCESCRLFRAPPPVSGASKREASASSAKRVTPTAKGKPAKKTAETAPTDAKAEPSEHGNAAAFGHPDLHVVVKELARYSDDRQTRERKLITIPVEVLEQHLITPVYRASRMRHGKVFIIDEAELIAKPGQNKLLKTLEEPPADTHIILVTSNEDRLLPTIRSRCERVAFVPLPDTDVEHWLARRAPELPEVQRNWLVEFSAGSLGRAALAMRFGLFAWAGRVLPAIDAMARGTYPAELGGAMKTSIDEFAQAWVDSHENASKEAANKLAASLMWTMITQHARRKLSDLSSPDAPRPIVPGDTVAAEAALNPWLSIIDAVANAERELDSNVNLGLVTDHAVARLYAAFEDAAATGPVTTTAAGATR